MKKLIDKIEFRLHSLIRGLKQLFKKGDQRLINTLLTTPTQGNDNLSQRPYPGLNSYSEEREHYFFGRKEEKNNILEILEYYSLCFLIGKSGIGKSSLINAGLVPALRKRDFVPVMIRINFDDPGELIQQVRNTIVMEMKKVDPKVPPFGNRLLWEYFQEVKLFNGFLQPVLIFDQFEEIFTRGNQRQKELVGLLRELIDLSENRVPDKVQAAYRDAGRTIPSDFKKDYRLIFAMREDYLPQLTGLRVYIPTLRFSIFRLEQMNFKQALAAVYEPAKKANLMTEETAIEIVKTIPCSDSDEFEFSLVNEDHKNNGETSMDPVLSEVQANKRIEPFLLNLLCYTLNEERITRNLKTPSPQILSTDVSKRNFDMLVSDYYSAITRRKPGLSLAIEDELLTPDGRYRKFSAKDNFKKAGNLLDKDVDYLINNKLLRRKQINDLEYLELIHDILVPIVARKKKRRDRTKRVAYTALYSLGGIAVFAAVLWFNLQQQLLANEKDAAVSRARIREIEDSVGRAQRLAVIEKAKQDIEKDKLDFQVIADKFKIDSLNARKTEDSIKAANDLKLKQDYIDLTDRTQKEMKRASDSISEQAKAEREKLDKVTRSYAAVVLAGGSQNYDRLPAVRNTLAMLAYDTLFGEGNRATAESFNEPVFRALLNASDIRGKKLQELPPKPKQARRNIDASFYYRNKYYVFPFVGVGVDNRVILNDTTLVRAWINKQETIAACLLKNKDRINLVITDLSGKLLHDTIRLASNEDVVTVLFSPSGSNCIYTSRITADVKNRPRLSGKVNWLNLNERRSQPIQALPAQDDEFILLDYRGASGLVGVSTKGKIYEWADFNTSSKATFIGRPANAITVSAIHQCNDERNYLYLGCENGLIYRWRTSENVTLFHEKTGSRITSIAGSKDGKWLTSGNYHGLIQLWRTDIQQAVDMYIKESETGYGAIVSLNFSQNSNGLVAVTEKGYVYSCPLTMPDLAAILCERNEFIKQSEWPTYLPNSNFKVLCH